MPTRSRSWHGRAFAWSPCRCAGFNNVDLAAARGLGITVARVPEQPGEDVVLQHRIREILEEEIRLLLTFPNVLITGHQGFFTHEALSGIAGTTLANLSEFEKTGCAVHEVSVERLA